MATAAKATSKKERDEDDEAPAAAPPKPAKRGGLLLPLIGVAVVAAGAAGGGVWFMTRHAAHPAAHVAAEGAPDAGAAEGGQAPAGEGASAPAGDGAAALYLDLMPAFVVNLADEEAIRFLQVEVELMARDSKSIDAAKDHMPKIRNALLLLFAQQQSHQLATREAKVKLQADALAEVQRALREEKVPAAIEGVYFTAFVIQ